MKKILLVGALLSILLLGGCSENKNLVEDDLIDNERQEENIENSENENNESENKENENNENEIIENEITFSYTSLEDLKNQNLVPSEAKIGEEYDIGSLKLGNTVYDVTYMKNFKEYEIGEICNKEHLIFYQYGQPKLMLTLSIDWGTEDYVQEVSTFKDKYLVIVTDNNEGDTSQYLQIYDENLNLIMNYVGNEQLVDWLVYSGDFSVQNHYDNYYVIDNEKITVISNDDRPENRLKVIYAISEENGVLKVDIIEKTTEGYKGGAGRT